MAFLAMSAYVGVDPGEETGSELLCKPNAGVSGTGVC